MKSHRAMASAVMLVTLASALLVLARPAAHSRGTAEDRTPVPTPVAIFDPDPNHIWNRLHACLLIRRAPDGKEYGADTLDPLLWWQTRHLLEGDSHRRALECLDEFLRTHAERFIADPIKRAIMQRDLWAVFDWTVANRQSPERQALQTRLVQVMSRLALTPEQIGALPDTYADAVASRQFPAEYDPAKPHRAFLPPDLLSPDGSWICLSGYSAGPTAIQHFFFSGRSRFLIFMRLPGGRQKTLEYVRSLRATAEPPMINRPGIDFRVFNLKLPQFPAGTEVAFLRQMVLIDADGKLVPTPVTESLQIRFYHAVTPGTQYKNFMNESSSRDQDSFEFRFSRSALFARRGGGLIAVQPEEKEYPTLFAHGSDWEAPSVILDRCRLCHAGSGIHSIRSRQQWTNRNQHSADPGWNAPLLQAVDWETAKTIERKQEEPNFKLLQQYWQTSIAVR
jgi:hypothetical protein